MSQSLASPRSQNIPGAPDARPGNLVPAHASRRDVDPPIAEVDGRPIVRSKLLEPLLESHGIGLLEQLIVLDCAERLADEKGIAVGDREIADERTRSLCALVDPLNLGPCVSIDQKEAERTLARVLADRNVSQKEFDHVLRRNALLRALVRADMSITDEDLQDEFERVHGESVTIRHIQLATLAEAARIKERINLGDEFAQLASVYSANVASRAVGGLLDPFARQDDRVPEALRARAFALLPGAVSEPIRVGEWFHLVKVEKRSPPSGATLAARRDEMVRRVVERRTEPAIHALYQKLFDQATITIHDPVLNRAFRRVHPDRVR